LDQPPTTKGPTPKQPPKPKVQSPQPKAHSQETGPKGPALHDAGPKGPADREARKRHDAERKKQQRASEALHKRIADLEGRIAEREAKVKDLEAAMSSPGFYDDRDASKHVIEQHQALMWEVGDLMAQWEALQDHAAQSES
jgi:hypothetical protein